MDAQLYKRLQETINDVLLENIRDNIDHNNEDHYYEDMAVRITTLLDARGIQVIESDKVVAPVKEEPVLVGHTTKPWGEKTFHVCEIGTPVYEFEGGYFIESHSLSENVPVKRVRFYKDRFNMLKPLNDA